MSDWTYAPATDEVLSAWIETRRYDDMPANEPDARAEFDRWLATVTPNPTNDQQVEAVAQVVYAHHTANRIAEWDDLCAESKSEWTRTARAVLAALREAVAGDE